MVGAEALVVRVAVVTGAVLVAAVAGVAGAKPGIGDWAACEGEC